MRGDTAADLDRLADLAGVQNSYWDIHGVLHPTPAETKRAILGALGFAVDSAADLADSLREFEQAPWRRGLAAATVLRNGHNAGLRIELALPEADVGQLLRWHIGLEDGGELAGEAALGMLAVTGARAFDGEAFQRRQFEVWDPVPWGHHRLTVEVGGRQIGTALIVAPAAAWLPAALARGERRWGLSCHLYALRRRDDWGVGDFSALGDLLGGTAGAGGGLVGINPLHALFPDRPQAASPYSPSSRLFLNPLYIDPQAVPFAGACFRALQADESFKRLLARARAGNLIDYPAAAALKQAALEALFADFRDLPADAQAGFEAHKAAAGEALHRFAVYHVLHEHFATLSWRDWPDRFRRPDRPDVAEFAAAHAERVDLYTFQQWLAEQQLAAAADSNPGMGLYRDLAVGVDANGADAWTDPDLIVGDGTFGAPPDAFNADGQDWSMPPVHPHRLAARAYAPFIDMLRANMRHAGALRIDHAMGLMRLYWIPPGAKPTEGAYLRYPMDDLMGILALESHRNRCLVVGEDLGTVPDDFRARMEADNILSYRVFYFERWPSRLFRRPEAYPRLALATATTHDLPTIAGHWNGADLDLRQRLGMAAEDDNGDERERIRSLLLDALDDQELAPYGLDHKGGADEAALAALTEAVLRYLARSPALLTMLNLDDLLFEPDQLNLPGTVDEYPNWRRRLGKDIEDLTADPWVARVLKAISEDRGFGPLDDQDTGEMPQISRA